MNQSNGQNRKISGTSAALIIGGLFVLQAVILFGWSWITTRSTSPQPLTQAIANTPPTSVIPTLFIPSPDCGSPTLVIGSTTFQIQTITHMPDGSLTIPPHTSGIAYWVEGTNTNYVFVLSPTRDNLTLQTTLTNGDLATIFWSDCSVASFAVSSSEAAQWSDPTLFDQSNPGLSVFVQTNPSASGFVIKGKPPEEIVAAPGTPMPDESGVLAEVSLLDITTSADGTTIEINISIKNYGETAFTLTINKVSLTPQGSIALEMINSKPRLPEKISAGETETFTFTFPRPAAPSATLKIFTVEYDIEGY